MDNGQNQIFPYDRNQIYFREKMNNPLSSWNIIYSVDADLSEDFKPESLDQ